MDKVYNKYFFTDFYAKNGGGSYDNAEQWEPFFENIARNIVDIFEPKTVLDAGCAFGYLVKALRDLGVEAYGFDISEYAIAQADEKIKPFVFVHSITDPLPNNTPQQFDLVLTIEVLEHLSPYDGNQAIKNLCSYSDTVIFTSTPDDIEDKTHINVRQSEYWAKEFAKNSFYRDLFQTADFICPWAMIFRRNESVEDVIFNYEINSRVDKIEQDKKLTTKDLYYGRIYFDCGEIIENNSAVFAYSNDHIITQKINIPTGCNAIRFDPVENYNCVIRELVIGSSNGILSVQQGNYDHEIDGIYYFFTFDPQLYIPVPTGTVYVEIRCNIIIVDSFFELKTLSELISSINMHIEESSKLVNEANALVEKRNGEIIALKNNFETEEQLYQNENNTLIEKHKREVAELKKEFEKEKQIYQNEKCALVEKHNSEIIELKNKLFREKKRFIKRHNRKKENEISKLRLNSDKLSINYTDSQNKISEIQAELEHYKKHYSDAIILRDRYQAELEHYKKHYGDAIILRDRYQAELEHYKKHYSDAIILRDRYQAEAGQWQNSYNIISSSQFWKMTAPARKFFDIIKFPFRKIKLLSDKRKVSVREKKERSVYNRIKSIADNKIISEEQRLSEENTVFARDIKFSILVPLYNTPLNFLEEMIASVFSQTYSDWELCLANGSDDEHTGVGKLVKKIAAKDKRIKYKKLKRNLGISENTNACIDMSKGDYIALFDHDDILHPSALFEVMRAICEKDGDFIYTDENTFKEKIEDAYCPHFKPDYSPDTLRSYNYICHFTVFKKSILKEIGGGFRKQFDGSQDYDMILRLTERAKHIIHIPKILYYWRAHQNSVAQSIDAKSYAVDAAKKALAEHLQRVGLEGTVTDSRIPSTYRINYKISDPLISIIIPNKDHIDDLEKCIDSIIKKSTYSDYEIIVVENNSTEKSTFEYYKKLKKSSKIQVVFWEHEFNYSKINNLGFQYCSGEYIVLLNNDIEIITDNWLEEMLMFAQRDDVGAVGAMLYYPDDTVQHAGVIVGLGGVAGHSHKNFLKGHVGYSYRLTLAQNLSCVTAACLMTKKSVWNKVNGFNEKYAVAFNDVDFCMRIRKAGYLNVWTPYAEAYHYESKSRGLEDTLEKQKRFQSEVLRFKNDWGRELIEGDPYYNVNLTLDREDFSLK